MRSLRSAPPTMLLDLRPPETAAPAAPPAPPPGAKARHGVPFWAVLGACVVVAALSLLLPSAPTYDPWAWIIWGREILHGDLVTDTGPSWKPLPALFTTPFALSGSAAPSLWLVVARAGFLLSLVLAFRVAARLGGRVAGGALVGALSLAPWGVKNAALGSSEGLMVACVLGALDRHLAGRRGQALLCGLAAAMLRPEAWPFFGLYGLWLVWRERQRLVQVAVAFVSLPVLWFGPELWGSGNLLRAAERAQKPTSNARTFADDPVVQILRDAWAMVTIPIAVGALLGVVVLVARRRSTAEREVRATGLVLLCALAWIGLVAYMTGDGFSGNQRYLITPVVLAMLVGAVGLGWAVQAVAPRLPAAGRAHVLTGLAVLAAVGFSASSWGSVDKTRDYLDYQGRLDDQLADVVQQAGGAATLRACGPVATGDFLVPAVAWQLHVHGRDVQVAAESPGLVFREHTNRGSRAVPSLGPLARGRTLAASDDWRIVARCAGEAPAR